MPQKIVFLGILQKCLKQSALKNQHWHSELGAQVNGAARLVVIEDVKCGPHLVRRAMRHHHHVVQLVNDGGVDLEDDRDVVVATVGTLLQGVALGLDLILYI